MNVRMVTLCSDATGRVGNKRTREYTMMRDTSKIFSRYGMGG